MILWVYWPLALAFIAFVLFGIPEWAAIHLGGPTFSKFMSTVANAGAFGKVWVLMWGMLIGGLAVHFLGWCMYSCPEISKLSPAAIAAIGL